MFESGTTSPRKRMDIRIRFHNASKVMTLIGGDPPGAEYIHDIEGLYKHTIREVITHTGWLRFSLPPPTAVF